MEKWRLLIRKEKKVLTAYIFILRMKNIFFEATNIENLKNLENIDIMQKDGVRNKYGNIIKH